MTPPYDLRLRGARASRWHSSTVACEGRVMGGEARRLIYYLFHDFCVHFVHQLARTQWGEKLGTARHLDSFYFLC